MTEATQMRLRKEILYFQEYRKLSKNAKKERIYEEEAADVVGHYEARLRGLAEVDNSVWDLDSRRNHVIVHDDQMCGRPMAACFEGNLEKGSVGVFLLDEIQHNEEYLYADGPYVDALVLGPKSDEGWVLTATHVDRFNGQNNFKQKLIFSDSPPFNPKQR